MFKATFLHRNADVEYFKDVHAPLAFPFPGVRKLTMGRIVANPMDEGKPEWNLINEIYFDDIDAYHKAYTSKEAEVAFEDVAWTDLSTTLWVVSEEEDLLPGTNGS